MQVRETVYNDFVHGRIDRLYQEDYASMKAFAARCLTDDYALMAEDCVQEAIVKAYHTRHTFKSPSQLKSFLYTCIHNECISLLRKTNSRANYIAQQDTLDDSLAASIIEQETLDLLHEAISQLPERYRQVFMLSYEQALSNAEVAQQLGITIDGLTKRKAKMISLLRKKLKGNEYILLLFNII